MTQQERWNTKFNREDYFFGLAPNRFIEENVGRITEGGRVLCLGEGEGRNAVFLAKKGYRVTALDASDVGLAKALRLAEREGVWFETLHTMVDAWTPEAESYEAVVCSFMHLFREERPPVFEKAYAALIPGGCLIAEFFSTEQVGFPSGGPGQPELLYTLAEFEVLFERVGARVCKLAKEIVHLDEGVGHQGEGSVIRMIIEKPL